MTYMYVVVFIFGLIFGSFVNVLIYRLPEGKSIVAPPSSCTSCGNRLKPLDLIPVLSYLFIGGKCRYCKAHISFIYPFVELLTAAVFVLLFARFGVSVAFFAFAFLAILLIAVFFIDMKHKIIPDELVLAGLVVGAAVFAYNIFRPGNMIYGDSLWYTPLIGLLAGAGFLLLVALIGFVIYKTDEAMGMGDVKLLAPIGLLLGWKLCLTALFLSILAAGIISIMLIILRVKNRRDTIPFGPFIVLGTFVTIMCGWNILNWYINMF
jgi:leader peptidase (prepilin peptidase)/N-methyltransferase